MFSTNLIIETERLLLRPFRIDDIESSYAMNLDAEVNKYTGDGGIVTKEEIKRRILEDVIGDYQKHGFGRLAVEFKENNKFIGFTGLKFLEDLNEVDIGYRSMKDYWGKGIATEAAAACINFGFETLGIKKIIAMVLPENIGSIKVLEKLNFEFEKTFIEDKHITSLYSLTRTNYKQNGKYNYK